MAGTVTTDEPTQPARETTMAETVHLYLKANGADIKGESSQTSLGREGSIECVYYEQAVKTAREAGSGMATGRRQYEPLLLRKRIDKSSPLIAKALVENQVIEGVFKFFRPNPSGDGTTQQFYTVSIKQGRVASQKQIVPDTIVPATSTEPPLEEVTFVFHTIKWVFTDGGIEHEDTWNQNR
jgi:type VI secretion system secreted protein Hcp